jgi:hypothetical protein
VIFVFHGDNQPALREGFLQLRKKYDVYRFWSGDMVKLYVYLSSPSLFEKRELVVLEDLQLREAVNFLKEFRRRGFAGSVAQDGSQAKDVVILFPRQFNKAEVKKLSGAQVRNFRDEIPKNVFPLLDALFARKKKQSLLEARRLLREGYDVDYLLKMFTWQLRNLTRVKSGSIKGINPYVVRKLKRFERSWGSEDLRRAFSLILQEDLRQKKGRKTPLDFLISDLIDRSDQELLL